MVKFIRFEDTVGRFAHINPAQVGYVRPTEDGLVRLVFGALPGGFHHVDVVGALDDVLALLEGRAPSTAPAGAPKPPTRQRKTKRP